MNSDRTDHYPQPVKDREALREWLRTALSVARGVYPYLDPKFGLDMVRIVRGNDPPYYLGESIREICELRDDLRLISCKCWQEGRILYAEVECWSIYGDVSIGKLPVVDLEEVK